DRILFENISFAIDRQEKVGLIGINGTGKSTLLKILSGQLNPDLGNITYPKDYLIDYLPQEPVFDQDMSIIDYILKGDLPVLQALREYEATLELLDETPENEALTRRLVHLQEKLDLLGGWELESQIKTVLTKLNIHHLSQNVLSLSGGQKKRVALAASIIRDSDLLILDEPTNHLDEISIQWLENFLLNKKSSILLVTHDRYFLDRITNKIFELDRGNLYSYLGNYSTFVEKKAERIELASAMESKRANLYRTELAWMRRGARARTTKQKARIDRFSELENQNFAINEEKVSLLSAYTRLGKKAIELHHLAMSYSKPLFHDFNAILQQGDRIGIIGPNGVGKTTLLNLIAGLFPPKEGTVDVGPTVKIGYFTQHFPPMAQDLTLIDYIRETAEYVTNEEGLRISASVMLERFLFDKSNHYSPIAKLSGGERRRLFLLK
ncbi:MAG: ABC-F family ATP-binding cassette domain-containing protein, partial [Vallitaleaceae bacterium]|nr:ABC-F family ATP-binding cassette domain-containing protein [Vallitaleaceae bacterium]